MKTRWPLLLLIGLSAFTLLMAMSSAAVQTALAFPPTSNIPTRVAIPTLALETPQPTATREKYALTPPPDSDVAEPLLTLTALSDLAFNQPTPTDGPSEIIADGKPHLVDFNAFWCSPCNQMRPGIIELEDQYEGQVTFDNINTDNRASQKLALKYRVQFIPLIVLLDKDLKEVNRLEGYHTKQEIDDALSELTAAK